MRACSSQGLAAARQQRQNKAEARQDRQARYLQLLVKFQQSLLVLSSAPEQVKINWCTHQTNGAVISREIAAGWLVQRFMNELPQLRLNIASMSMNPAKILEISLTRYMGFLSGTVRGRRPE